jgi:hypothetical protein
MQSYDTSTTKPAQSCVIIDLKLWRLLRSRPEIAVPLAKLHRRLSTGAISPEHAAQAAAFILAVLT